MADETFPGWHGTTILAVRRGGRVVVAGDGQVSVGQTVMKGMGRAMMGTGEAEGETRATDAALAALHNPLLENHGFGSAKVSTWLVQRLTGWFRAC